MFGDRVRASTLLHLLNTLIQLINQLLEVARIFLKLGIVAIYVGFQDTHRCVPLARTAGAHLGAPGSCRLIPPILSRFRVIRIDTNNPPLPEVNSADTSAYAWPSNPAHMHKQ